MFTLTYLVDKYLLTGMTVAVSLALFGNIIDNTEDHKYLVTICNIILATLYTIYGSLLIYDKNH